MSAQTALDEDAPMILDATCSDKKIWPRYASIRMDIRRDVNPDIVASACYLPFKDGIFQEIYCDPPHLIRNSELKPSSIYAKHSMNRFALWRTKNHWLKFATSTNKEFARVLKTSGKLEYKISCAPHDTIQKRQMALYANFEITAEAKRNSASHWTDAITYFLTLKPKPCHK